MVFFMEPQLVHEDLVFLCQVIRQKDIQPTLLDLKNCPCHSRKPSVRTSFLSEKQTTVIARDDLPKKNHGFLCRIIRCPDIDRPYRQTMIDLTMSKRSWSQSRSKSSLSPDEAESAARLRSLNPYMASQRVEVVSTQAATTSTPAPGC